MKILVPLDGSRLADGILAHVRRLLMREASSIHLTHIQFGTEGAPAEEERIAIRDHMAACKELLESTGETVEMSLHEGDPAARILDLLESGGFDLCAMATHGRSGVSRWVRGSVAERVLRNTSVPVYLANPKGLSRTSDDVPFERILVPLDGSSLSEKILPLVTRLAKDAGAEVTLLHIDTPARGAHPVPEIAGRKSQQRAEKMLDELRCKLEASGIAKTRVVGRYGDPAGEIIELVKESKPDLVAMSSHGRSGISRWRFGSVAEKVLRTIDCPLLVRPAQRKGAAD